MMGQQVDGRCPAWGLLKDAQEVIIRVYSVFLGGLDQAERDRAGLRSLWGESKEKVLASDHEGLEASLGAVVGYFKSTVIKISLQGDTAQIEGLRIYEGFLRKSRIKAQ